MCYVFLEPDGIEFYGFLGDTLLDALQSAGIPWDNECGGNCTCTTCIVQVEVGEWGLSEMEPEERDRLSTADVLPERARLACQALLLGRQVVLKRVFHEV